jgi:hypothetical protein
MRVFVPTPYFLEYVGAAAPEWGTPEADHGGRDIFCRSSLSGYEHSLTRILNPSFATGSRSKIVPEKSGTGFHFTIGSRFFRKNRSAIENRFFDHDHWGCMKSDHDFFVEIDKRF